MQYLHIKRLEEYHPGYKDRELQWCKTTFKMLNADPEFEMLHEIDRWRFIAFVILELQIKKPVPLDTKYLQKKGFNFKHRSLRETLVSLHNSVSVVTEQGESLCIREEEYKEDKEQEEEKEGDVLRLSPLSLFELFKITVKNLPQPSELTTDRAFKCKLRLRERPLTEWQKIFELMDQTPFLLGDNERGWRASFDWIIGNATNAVKVLEGKYQNPIKTPMNLNKKQAANMEALSDFAKRKGAAGPEDLRSGNGDALVRISGN